MPDGGKGWSRLRVHRGWGPQVKLYRSRFIEDQSDVPVAAASFRKARSYSNQASPGNRRAVWIIRSLYFVKSGHRWGWAEHITIWKSVKASVHVKMSLISNTRRLFETNSPCRNVCGSCSTEQRLADNRSAKSTNWPPIILDGGIPGTDNKSVAEGRWEKRTIQTWKSTCHLGCYNWGSECSHRAGWVGAGDGRQGRKRRNECW